MTKRSTVDSKDYMAEALLFLMKRKPAAKITVSEITERAGVSRATWFRHFTDKREAVVYGLARLSRMSVCLSIRRKIQGRKSISGIKH